MDQNDLASKFGRIGFVPSLVFLMMDRCLRPAVCGECLRLRVSIRRGPWAEGSWADQPVVAGGFLLASRSLAALRWLAIRLRASLIGRSPMRLGIVIVEPFLGFGMARVCGAGGSVEGLVEAGYAAAILGRRIALAGNVPKAGEIGIAGANAGHPRAGAPRNRRSRRDNRSSSVRSLSPSRRRTLGVSVRGWVPQSSSVGKPSLWIDIVQLGGLDQG